MSIEGHELPETPPAPQEGANNGSPEKKSVKAVEVSPDKLLAIQSQEIAFQRKRIDDLLKKNFILGESVLSLNRLIREFEQEDDAIKGKSSGRIQTILEIMDATIVSESEIDQLDKDIEAGDRRLFSAAKKLHSEDVKHSLDQEKIIHEQAELINQKNEIISSLRASLSVANNDLKLFTQKYKKDTEMLVRQLRVHHKGMMQTDEHLKAVEALQARNRLLEQMFKKMEQMEQEMAFLKKVRPTPDIQITHDGDIQVKLSYLQPAKKKQVVSVHQHKPEEVKEKPSFLKRLFGGWFR